MNKTDKFEEEFDIEQMEEIGKQTISQVLDKVCYNEEKTNVWISHILDTTLKELSKLNKPFKYIATCILMEKNGSPLTTSNISFWDPNSDGLCSIQMGNETLDCILCIYAIKT